MSISFDNIFLLFKDTFVLLILAIFGIIGGHLCLACDYFKKMAETAVRTQGTTDNSLKIVLVSILHV